ncbi:helicase-related protein [Ruminococcus sp.]|uniref:helicase-related protein n=1 Tax=Ruminococcus sp. TaxID=41978 RepID=UPI00351FFD5F
MAVSKSRKIATSAAWKAALSAETITLTSARLAGNRLTQKIRNNADTIDSGKAILSAVTTISTANRVRKTLIQHKLQRKRYKAYKQAVATSKAQFKSAKHRLQIKKKEFKSAKKLQKQKLNNISNEFKNSSKFISAKKIRVIARILHKNIKANRKFIIEKDKVEVQKDLYKSKIKLKRLYKPKNIVLQGLKSAAVRGAYSVSNKIAQNAQDNDFVQAISNAVTVDRQIKTIIKSYKNQKISKAEKRPEKLNKRRNKLQQKQNKLNQTRMRKRSHKPKPKSTAKDKVKQLSKGMVNIIAKLFGALAFPLLIIILVFGLVVMMFGSCTANSSFLLGTYYCSDYDMAQAIETYTDIAYSYNQESDTLNLNVPKCEMHIVDVEPTELQEELVNELSDRADEVNNGSVDPSQDNMLKITGDGRKLGLDPRLIDAEFEDNPGTKLNVCVNNVFDIYEKTTDKKLTQIIFCDLGVPGKGVNVDADSKDEDTKSVTEIDSLEESGKFCVYDDIKDKLIAKGVSSQEIAFIHDAKNEKQKSELFAKVRSGEVRILLGSTGKMGTGTNVQDRIIALHNLDVPWRPSDLEQRRGRMVRQGNINEKVHLYRYVTKGTFDAYSYQLLEKKQKFISQIMTSKAPARKCSDVDQASLSYSEIKALCTGDERIREKLTLENRVKELTAYKSEYDNTRYELEDKVNAYPEQRKDLLCTIGNIQKDIDKLNALPKDDEGSIVYTYNFGDAAYTNSEEDRKSAAKALGAFVALSRQHRNETIKVGDISGYEVEIINKGLIVDDITARLGNGKYKVNFGSLNIHNLSKLENLFTKFNEFLSNAKKELNRIDYDYNSAKEMLTKPFEFEQELTEKTQRLADLTTALNIELAQRQNTLTEKECKTRYFSKNSILHKGKSSVISDQNSLEVKRSAPEL